MTVEQVDTAIADAIAALPPASDLPTLPGIIDEAYVFAGALTKEQVQRLYQDNRIEGSAD